MLLKFFGRLLPATIGAIFGVFIVVMMLIGSLVGTVTEAIENANSELTISPNSVLQLDLTKPIVEHYEYDPISKLDFSSFSGEEKIGLVQLKEALTKAAKDDNISGVLLNLSDIDGGFAAIREIRASIQKFKSSDKFVFAYSQVLSEKGLYLASVADEIYLNPVGYLELNGLTSRKMFFKGTLDKLGIQAEIFKVGDFKSAVEPLLRKDMSDSSEYQTKVFLESIYSTFLKDISKDLELDKDTLRQLSDAFAIRDGKSALAQGIISNTGYADEVESRIKELMGTPIKDKINYVGLNKYRMSFDLVQKKNKNQIAVLIAEGEIVSGKGEEGQIGATDIIRAIRKAKTNDTIKAVVLRVNSPGGSALASEVIWRELELLRKEKPVICSMSNVAASGGYYIATGCDSIVANPNTITGSIGVFGVLLNMDRFLNDKLGVTVDQVNTGKFSDFGSGTRALTKEEREIMQSEVDEIYELFISRVATARMIDENSAKRLAKGRVYSGADAHQLGLVDVLGDLNDAITLAANSADLGEGAYSVTYLPEQKMFLEKILETLNPDAQSSIEKELNTYVPYLKMLKSIAKKENRIQTRLPYELVIE